MKLNRIAIETTCFKKVSPDLMYEALAKNGIKQMEFYAGAPLFCHYDSLPATNQELEEMQNHVKEKLSEYGMKIAVLAPQSVDYEINIASDVEEIREKSIRYFIGYLNDLKALGCEDMMLTSGWGYFDQEVEPAWNRSCDSLKKITAEAQRLGVNVLLRPIWKYGTNLVNNADTLKKMLDDVGNSALKVALDVDGMEEGESITSYFKMFGTEKIRYFKFSNFTADGEVVTGDGTQNVKAYFDELEQNGYKGVAGITLNYEHTEDPEKYVTLVAEQLKTICEE